MKKISVSIILNVFLFIAVAVLYFLHFTSKSPEKGRANHLSQGVSSSPVSAAYVNLDTLLNNLDMYFDMQNSLKTKQNESQVKLDNNARAFEQSVVDLQNKMDKGLITRSNAMKMQEELKGEEERILRLRENLTYQLAEEKQVMDRSVIEEIMKFLKEYNADRNYQMIISNSYGGTLLYANDSMNITQDVLNGLNARYAETKGKK